HLHAPRFFSTDPATTELYPLSLHDALPIFGATSAIFSVVSAVLLKPLPFRDADRLVLVRQQILKLGPQTMRVSAPDTVEYRKSEVFEEAGAMLNRAYDLSGEGGPEQVAGARISASLFPLLGAA